MTRHSDPEGSLPEAVPDVLPLGPFHALIERVKIPRTQRITTQLSGFLRGSAVSPFVSTGDLEISNEWPNFKMHHLFHSILWVYQTVCWSMAAPDLKDRPVNRRKESHRRERLSQQALVRLANRSRLQAHLSNGRSLRS